MSHLFHRRCNAPMPIAEHGEGVWLTAGDGRRFLDACGGAAVSCLGHGHPAVREAIARQAGRLAYAHTSFFSSEPAEALADWLIERAPQGIDRVLLVSGGSEAVEAAVKLARQYHLERGEPQRRHIVARRQSYHGNTLGALAAGGNALRKAPFAPLLSDAMLHIDPCFYWREGQPGETPQAYGQRVANQLETLLLSVGPDQVAAFIAEPVVGATLGAVAAEAGYFRRIREICDQYGVLLILDEVMCGMGRTGTLFACEAEGIAPDIVCIAKGLGGGYQPIGAMLCSAKIHDTIAAGSGAFQHGHTYLGHPVAAAAALAVVGEIERANLLAQVLRRGDELRAALQASLGEHPQIGQIRGRGLFVGVELVADRDSNSPLPHAWSTHARIKRAAFERGLMVYPMGGTVDGRSGDHVLLAPPYIIGSEEIGLIAERLRAAIEAALSEARAEHGAAGTSSATH
ncbi:MAG: aspartate aminotransferase family protein [Burkholderiaceae bacterium]